MDCQKLAEFNISLLRSIKVKKRLHKYLKYAIIKEIINSGFGG